MSARRAFREALLLVAVAPLALAGLGAACATSEVWCPGDLRVSEVCVDGPLLSLQGGGFALDGVRLTAEQLAKGFADKGALWQTVQPGKPMPGDLLAAISEDAPMANVAPALELARAAGFPKILALRRVPPKRWRTRTLGDLAYGPRARCTPISPAALPDEGTWGSFVDRAAGAR